MCRHFKSTLKMLWPFINTSTVLRICDVQNSTLKYLFFNYIFRFAVQLLAPSAVAAKIAGRNNITVEDIKDIGELFLDAKSSAIMLEANADKYMK